MRIQSYPNLWESGRSLLGSAQNRSLWAARDSAFGGPDRMLDSWVGFSGAKTELRLGVKILKTANEMWRDTLDIFA